MVLTTILPDIKPLYDELDLYRKLMDYINHRTTGGEREHRIALLKYPVTRAVWRCLRKHPQDRLLEEKFSTYVNELGIQLVKQNSKLNDDQQDRLLELDKQIEIAFYNLERDTGVRAIQTY